MAKLADAYDGMDQIFRSKLQALVAESQGKVKIVSGYRSPERQQQLVNDGFSQTLKSKHLTGHAVDLGAIVDGKLSWDKQYYPEIAKAMKKAAADQQVNIRWGGEFKTFYDGPHFELV
mgnify:CR=1 FL=1